MPDPIDYVRLDDALQAVAMLGQTVRDAGLLNGALARPQTFAFGVEVYPTLHLKAGALCDSLNRSHPLIDGNKRLSWLLTALFYQRNGYTLLTDPDEGERFVLEVASGHVEVSDIGQWLELHVT